MKDFVLNFKLKGKRNYVHGSDIYAELGQYLRSEGFDVSQIDLSFHKIAYHQLNGELYPADQANLPPTDPVCIYKFTQDSTEPYIIYLFETDTEVKESYSYEEEKIVGAASLNTADKSITFASSIPYSTIEKVIALNKALLTEILTGPGKWYFTRITLDKDINAQAPETIHLKLVKNIGSRITKTKILLDDQEQGYIYFSKV